jgi:hypothetical protein
MPDVSPRAQVSGPRTQRKRPGDLTGVNSQKLAEKREQDKADAAQAQAEAAAAERAELLSTVVDYTQGGITQDIEVEETEPEVLPQFMTIRVNYPIEDMTFGREVVSPPEYDEHGNVVKAAVLGRLNTYNFVEGQQYKVPWDLGVHLKGLGYVYDF